MIGIQVGLGLPENIQIHKAAGPDSICWAILKRCAKAAAMFLMFIFKQSLITGDTLHDWHQALVRPVLKRGNPKRPENYHPFHLHGSFVKWWNLS